MTRTTFTPRTAAAIIIANMIGVGVFTVLGQILVDIDSLFPVMMLWVIGGVAATCGALSYAELGASLPRSGGEYHFLSEAYHPAAGFVSGLISSTIGYAAPAAAIALAFSRYLSAVLPGDLSVFWQRTISCLLVLSLAALHMRSRRASGRTQTVFTAIKIIVVTAFILAAFLLTAEPQNLGLLPSAGDLDVMTSFQYGTALALVFFAYTGWNSATYISGEMKSPQRDLPKVLFFGTALVTLVYVLLNLAFLYAAPVDALRDGVEIGYTAAKGIFGDVGARIVGGMLAMLLISTVSAMMLAGPRALQAVGKDYPAMQWFSKSTAEGVPWAAILFQAAVTVFLILTQTFKLIVIFAASIMALNSLLAVIGLFILRRRQPDLPRPYKTWGYPVIPMIYIVITSAMLVLVAIEKPKLAIGGFGFILAGFVVWLVSERIYGGRRPGHD